MAVSVVNGFVCYSSCDVSKAKQSKDPHPSTNASKPDEREPTKSGFADQPAVVFGGALSAPAADSVTAVAGTEPANATDLSRSKFLIDVLA